MVAAVWSGAGESRYRSPYSRARTTSTLGDVGLIAIAPLMTSNPFAARVHVTFEARLIGRAPVIYRGPVPASVLAFYAVIAC